MNRLPPFPVKKHLVSFLDTTLKTLNKFLVDNSALYIHREIRVSEKEFKSIFVFWKKQNDKRGKRGKDKKKRNNENYLGLKNALKSKEID